VSRPLAALDARGLVGVLTDVDDTLTTGGRLTADAYQALEALHDAGLRIVPVTGRSAGWAHMIARTWPVDAVVAESGGLYLHRRGAGCAIGCRFHAPREQVEADRTRLAECAARVLRAVPGLAPASDNAYRLVDLALDYSEEVPRVPDAEVQRAMAMFREAGFQARASSVHVNAWAGTFDKAPTSLACLRELFGDEGAPERWVFVGDAPNDESMFGAFVHSVAVANIRPHLPRLAHRPAHVTEASFGAGFRELAEHLLAARR